MKVGDLIRTKQVDLAHLVGLCVRFGEVNGRCPEIYIQVLWSDGLISYDYKDTFDVISASRNRRWPSMARP